MTFSLQSTGKFGLLRYVKFERSKFKLCYKVMEFSNTMLRDILLATDEKKWNSDVWEIKSTNAWVIWSKKNWENWTTIIWKI